MQPAGASGRNPEQGKMTERTQLLVERIGVARNWIGFRRIGDGIGGGLTDAAAFGLEAF